MPDNKNKNQNQSQNTNPQQNKPEKEQRNLGREQSSQEQGNIGGGQQKQGMNKGAGQKQDKLEDQDPRKVGADIDEDLDVSDKQEGTAIPQRNPRDGQGQQGQQNVNRGQGDRDDKNR